MKSNLKKIPLTRLCIAHPSLTGRSALLADIRASQIAPDTEEEQARPEFQRFCLRSPTGLAGTPATTAQSGTSRVTTAPIAMTE